MRTFKSSLDKTSIITSVLVILLSICLSIFALVFRLPHETGATVYAILITPVFLGIVCLVAYLLSPMGITVYATELVIDRKVKPVTLSFQDIKNIRLLPITDMKGTIRTMGNGGLWGYTGKFYNKKMGSMTFYCSQSANYVLIELNSDKKIIVSPDEPDEFMAEIKRQHPAFNIGN